MVYNINYFTIKLNNYGLYTTQDIRALEKDKLEKVLGGIANLNRLPSAVFMVDIHHEHIALAEAKRLGMKTIAMVDTNSDPTLVDYAIPSNDDASKAIQYITNYLVAAIREGLDERKAAKGDEKEGAE